MTRSWLDDDDELTWPTDWRNILWGVLLFTIGMSILITLPPTGAALFLVGGWIGCFAGIAFVAKGMSR